MATYYVATTGSNSNPGTIGSPFLTVAKGLSVMVSGDTLYIRAGTYAEDIDSGSQTIPTGTSWSNAPLISAYNNETVILRGTVGLWHSYIQYVIFNGIIFDPQNNGVNQVFYTDGGANHVRVQNCEIKNGSHQGFGLFADGIGGFHEIINCSVHNNGSTGGLDHGFYLHESNCLIERCTIYSNWASGIQLYPGPSNVVIRRNLIYNNAVGGNSPNGDAFGIVSHGSGHLIYNNIVRDHANANSAIYLRDGFQGVYNNTIYNAPNGITVGSGADGSGTIIKNNIIYSTGTSINGGGNATKSNNLTSNPNFVNEGSRDFHLTAGSAAIDNGVTIN